MNASLREALQGVEYLGIRYEIVERLHRLSFVEVGSGTRSPLHTSGMLAHVERHDDGRGLKRVGPSGYAVDPRDRAGRDLGAP
jgi:hypothetical protein